MIANEELGGDYAPVADPTLAAQIQAQKKATSGGFDVDGSMPEISGVLTQKANKWNY